MDGEAQRGPIEEPDVVLEAGVEAFYWLFVERRWKGVKVTGERELLEQLLDAASAPAPAAPALV